MTYGEWELSVALHKLLLALSESGLELSIKDEVEEVRLQEALRTSRRIADRYRLHCCNAGRMPY